MPISKADIALLKLLDKPINGLTPHGPLTATMTVRAAKEEKFTWYMPIVSPCSKPIPFPDESIEQIVKFKNPF